MINLPNLITLARLCAAPLVVYLVLDSSWAGAFWLFVLAGLSDAVDGYLAKRFNIRSLVGGYLDPLADKALLVSAYVVLGHMGSLPAWLVILVVFRDLLIIGGALLVHTLTGKLRMQPLLISKINTAMQFFLPAYVLAELGLGVDSLWVVQGLIFVVAGTTLLSGAAYVVTWVRRTAGMEESQ